MFRPSGRPSRPRAIDGPPLHRDIISEQQSKSLDFTTQLAEPMASPTMRTVDSNSALLNAFQTHVDDMRNLVMCKICIRPLYEPFSLGNCGHTYCYSCLSEWFTSKTNRHKRSTCPDCRAEVKVQPAPNYLLRELVHMFVSRTELLPRDETLQEHHEAMLAEARLVENDKNDKGANGGLFKGAFKTVNFWDNLPRGIIRDFEDGVDRCPMCSWELEEGLCNHCGFDAAGSAAFSDDDDHSFSTDYDRPSELDGEMDLEDDDGFGYGFDLHHDIRMPPYRHYHRRGDTGGAPTSAISLTSDSDSDVNIFHEYGRRIYGSMDPPTEDDEDDSEDDSEDLHNFIVHDQEADSDDDDDTVTTRSARSPISVSSAIAGTSALGATNTAESEEDDTDEEIIAPARKSQARNPRRPRVIIDSDSDEEEQDDDEGEMAARDVDQNGVEEDASETSELPSFATPSPPRPAADRLARRQAQRARSRRNRT